MKKNVEEPRIVGVLTRVTEPERDKAQEKAKEMGLPLSAVLRKLMNDWANDNQFKLSF